MKNRKREICTSGSVRDEDGQPPHLLGRLNLLHLAAGAAALPAVSRFAWAQAYPTRPVRIVVGFAPGGAFDIMARLIGQWLSERLGQPFVIENRPGGGGNIGTEAVVRAPADGYTLLLVGVPNAINATLYQKLNFNLIHDIAPVAGIDREPQVMVVNPSVPAKTVPEFIAYAKAHPGKISMASQGIGGSGHLTGQLFQMRAGVNGGSRAVSQRRSGGNSVMISRQIGASVPMVSQTEIDPMKIALSLMFALVTTTALADPLPVAKPLGPGGSCPFGYTSSGSFCTPSQGAQDAVAKPSNGTCPFGWMASGSYCLRTENVQR